MTIVEPQPRRRILFVDDDVRIIQGIQRMLRPMRQEWEVLAAEGGTKALEILAIEKVDVVVSDMRMPGMDGAELLQEVMRLYPNTVRIILSGQADRESIMRSLSATHQYLAKPCDPDRLRAAVAKACALRDLLGDDPLQRLVANLTTVPSLPLLYRRIQDELRKEEPDVRAIGEVVAQDMGMSSKMLQLVNSARFGMTRPVHSAVEAVSLIGISTVKALAMGAHVFSELGAGDCGGLEIEALWQRAMVVSLLARRLAQHLRLAPEVIDMSFTAGLLLDSGMLLLAVNRSAEYAQVIARAQQADLCALERESYHADHAAVGAYLLGLWGLPERIVEAVAFHHRPADGCITTISPLVVVHLAAALATEADTVHPLQGGTRLDPSVVDQLGLAPRLAEFRALASSAR